MAAGEVRPDCQTRGHADRTNWAAPRQETWVPRVGAEDPARERVLKASKHFGPGGFPGAARRRDNDRVVRLSRCSRLETWEEVPASRSARWIEPCSTDGGSSGTSAEPAAGGGRRGRATAPPKSSSERGRTRTVACVARQAMPWASWHNVVQFGVAGRNGTSLTAVRSTPSSVSPCPVSLAAHAASAWSVACVELAYKVLPLCPVGSPSVMRAAVRSA